MRETPAQPCDWCGYDLTGLPANHVCPECGVAAADPAMQSQAEEWFVGRGGRWLIDPPRRVVRFVHTPRCTRVALRRYAAYILIPLLAYAAWLCLWCQFGYLPTYSRWWELDDEPGVRRDPDRTNGCSLALGDHSTRIRPYLPERSLTPWHNGRFHWDVASTTVIWAGHWPRSEFWRCPASILAATLTCRVSLTLALGACALLSTRNVSRRILWRSAWNLSSAQLATFPVGIAILSALVPPLAIAGMYAEHSTLTAVFMIATLLSIAVQPLCAAYLSAAIGDSCGWHAFRVGGRALCFGLWLLFIGAIVVCAACVFLTSDAIFQRYLR